MHSIHYKYAQACRRTALVKLDIYIVCFILGVKKHFTLLIVNNILPFYQIHG